MNSQNITDFKLLSKLIILYNQKNPDEFLKSGQCAREAEIKFQSYDFGPKKSSDSLTEFKKNKDRIQAQIRNLDTDKSFKSLMTALWYSQLPCFDVKNVTAKKDGEKSMLKTCQWKGLPIVCSAIFKTLPTDDGMCCVFNFEKAEKIFKDSEYSRFVNEQNNRDKKNSFQSSALPEWYINQGFHRTKTFYITVN